MSSRELLNRIESLGAELSIDDDFDATVFGLAVTKDHLGEALDLLGAMVRRPQLSSVELDKLKKREADRLADAARARGSWGAYRVIYDDLFTLPSEHHPYATWSATASEVQRISGADCRSFHKRFYVPRNAFLVIAGDTTPEADQALAQKALGGWSGGDAPVISFSDPNPPEARRITLVDRPRSSQSEVYVAALGPPRADASFPAFAVTHQILGGAPGSRLFGDVREKRSLAYTARSFLTELAHGPSVQVAYVGTQTAKTGLALAAVLDDIDRLAASPASEEEVRWGQRYLSDRFAVKLDTIGAVADELVRLHVLGLSDDYDDGYRKSSPRSRPRRRSRRPPRTCAAGTRSSWSPGTPRSSGRCSPISVRSRSSTPHTTSPVSGASLRITTLRSRRRGKRGVSAWPHRARPAMEKGCDRARSRSAPSASPLDAPQPPSRSRSRSRQTPIRRIPSPTPHR